MIPNIFKWTLVYASLFMQNSLNSVESLAVPVKAENSNDRHNALQLTIVRMGQTSNNMGSVQYGMTRWFLKKHNWL